MTNLLLNESSLTYLSNVLNEVLHGFAVDYEISLGARREDVMRIFQELGKSRGGKSGVERLSSSQVRVLLACSDLCLRELADGEFETRLGEAPEVARQVNQSLAAGLELSPAVA